jgi:hypothetical protein
MPETKHPLKVFLSHASQDKPIVDELYKRLLSEGWIKPLLRQRNFFSYLNFDKALQNTIDSSDAIVVFISKTAVEKAGYIQKELRLIHDASMYRPMRDPFLIPLRLEECDPPREFNRLHWANYFGSEKEKTYKSLLKSLKYIYDKSIQADAGNKLRSVSEEQQIAKEEIRPKTNEKKYQQNTPVASRGDYQEIDIRRVIAVFFAIFIVIYLLVAPSFSSETPYSPPTPKLLLPKNDISEVLTLSAPTPIPTIQLWLFKFFSYSLESSFDGSILWTIIVTCGGCGQQVDQLSFQIYQSPSELDMDSVEWEFVTTTTGRGFSAKFGLWYKAELLNPPNDIKIIGPAKILCCDGEN